MWGKSRVLLRVASLPVVNPNPPFGLILDPTESKNDDDREDASSMVTAGATADTTEGNSRASRESGLLCSHAYRQSIEMLSPWSG